MDYWSPLSGDEVNAVVLSREFAVEMGRMFDNYLAQSDQFQWDKWGKKTFHKNWARLIQKI